MTTINDNLKRARDMRLSGPRGLPVCDHCGLEQIRVSRKGAERFKAGHPWIFRSDITDTAGAQAGDTVQVLDARGQFIGQAHYSAASQIALRMLSRTQGPVDIGARIAAAHRFRETIVRDSSAYRLVHAEADFLPALIVDRYGDAFTIQTLNQGMDRATSEIVAALEAQFSPRAIVARNDSGVRSLEQLPREVRLLAGELDAAAAIQMNGLKMEADLLRGQKTGVFLDQRENYLAAARYAKGGALDCFTSTGGFALHLARSCERVEAIDSSSAALATGQRNADLNGISNVAFPRGRCI